MRADNVGFNTEDYASNPTTKEKLENLLEGGVPLNGNVFFLNFLTLT